MAQVFGPFQDAYTTLGIDGGLSELVTDFAGSMKLALGRVKTYPAAIHPHNHFPNHVHARDCSWDSSSTAISPGESDSKNIARGKRRFLKELWKSTDKRSKQYAKERTRDAHPLGPIGDGEAIVLDSPAALSHFHNMIHHSTFIHKDRVHSLIASWPKDVPFSTEDAINLVCVLSQLSDLASLSIDIPIRMPLPFVDALRPGRSKALATMLMLEGLAYESHAGTRQMARHNHILPEDILSVLGHFAALPNLRILDTTLGFLTRLPERACANVASLSVKIISAQQKEVCATFERKFGRSLRRLKLTRLFKHAPTRESPARICALLGAKCLEYLEVVDRDATGCVRRVPTPKQSDVLLGTEEGRAAANECPQLRTIIWEPSWISCLTDIYEIEWATHRYQDDLLAMFGSPVELYLRVNSTQGVRVALEEDGRCSKWPWVRDIESQRWDES